MKNDRIIRKNNRTNSKRKTNENNSSRVPQTNERESKSNHIP